MHGLLTIVSLVLLCAFGMPGALFIPAMLGILAAVCLGGIWLVRYTVAAILGARFQDRILRRPGARRRWATTPLCLLAIVILLVTQVPLYVTFWISKGAMERMAAELMQPSVCYQPNANRWLGVYPVDHVETIPGGMRFLVKGAGFIDREGFAFSPDGPPPGTSHQIYAHFWGSWYIWVQRF